MKKAILSIAMVAICAGGAFAQVSGGIKLGANFANQKVSAEGLDFSPDSRTSLHGGVYLTLQLSDNFGIQPELLYNSVGHKMSMEFMGQSFESVMKANYLSLPILVRYNPVDIFNIHAGPQLGFLMSAKYESDGESEDAKESYKGLDLGLGIGAGVDLPMGIGLTARYVLGLANVAEAQEEGADGTMKNNTFQIAVSYKLFGR